jgi:hypothetical protein
MLESKTVNSDKSTKRSKNKNSIESETINSDKSTEKRSKKNNKKLVEKKIIKN